MTQSTLSENARTPTPIDAEEQARLDACQARIRDQLDAGDRRLREYAEEIKTRKEYMWEARRDMDHLEKIAVRQTIEQTEGSAEIIQSQQLKLTKLMRSPYFGRFDFQGQGEARATPIYVGVHHFRDEDGGDTLVYDWRAPVASMFYDHEPGPAHYEAPSGRIHGQMPLKRQFRIRDGRLEFVLDTGVNIVDDVLQDELGRASSDEGMKNIVATIQRDQNAIIRNDDAPTLIIQGVAGSGKTSIALHRIAFLLYRHKDTLSSKDILILSPNRVFADYIGNVLPELGEEQVPEIGMEQLADELLEHEVRFQSFFEQTAALVEGRDTGLPERLAVKGSLEFLTTLNVYARHVEASSFQAVEWRSGRKIVPDWFFAESWAKHSGVDTTERVRRVLAACEQQIVFHYRAELYPEERSALREAIRGMVNTVTLRRAYEGLYAWIGRPELFKAAGGRLEYADVFPLIYLKMKLGGVQNPYASAKHLLIDEMQDYSPLQYAVIERLFSCRKTILGDTGQAVNPFSGATAETIRDALRAAEVVRLTKSYRSSWDIMDLALAITPNPELQAMKRQGLPPDIRRFGSTAKMMAAVIEQVRDFQDSEHRSLAVIAKTQRQAARVHKALTESGIEARLLNADSIGFSTGVLVCTAHLAKGLEFDRVIVPDVSAVQYQSALDRNLLYVACTRAMHRLSLFAAGDFSPLVPAERVASA